MNPLGKRALPPVAALLLLALFAILGLRLSLDHDISRMLPDSDENLSRGIEVMARSLERAIVDVGSEGTTPLSLEKLGEAADQLAERLLASGQATTVRRSYGAQEALPLVQVLRARAARLLPDSAYGEIERRIDPTKTLATLETLARRIQEPDGGWLKQRAARDPLGLTDLALKPLAGMTAGFEGARLVDGRILSADGRHLLVIVEPGFPASDTGRDESFIKALSQTIVWLEQQPEYQGLRIRHLGTHRATLDNARQIKHDVKVTTTIGVSLCAILAVLCLGRFTLALLALFPALAGAVCALGIFSLFRERIPGAVIGFGSVLLGLTIDFAIHVLFRLDRTGAQALRGPLRLSDLPVRALLMGGMTTALAFLSLQASSLPGLRDIGVFGALGILVAVASALLVLPALANMRRHPSVARAPLLDLQALVLRARRLARPVMGLALLLTPVLAWGLCYLRVDADPTNLSGISAETREDEKMIQATWGEAFKVTSLVVEAPELEQALLENDRLLQLLEQRKGAGLLRDHGSIANILPSQKTQARRLATWQSYWTVERRQGLRASLQAAIGSTPFRSGAFDPFLTWLEQTPETITLDGYQSLAPQAAKTLLGDRIHRDEAAGVWSITTPVFTDNWEQVAGLNAALRRDLPSVLLLNKEGFARTLADMVVREVWILGLLALALVTVVVLVWMGQILLSTVIIGPLLLSLLWTLGWLGWLGVPINLANAIFVVFLFGVAVDYSIFLTTSRLDYFRTGIDRTTEAQASVLLCTLTTLGGFGSLAAAGHPVLHSIGVTALVGLLSAAIATQLFVPAMTKALLQRSGPNGTPGPRNIYSAWWTFQLMVGGAIYHLLTNRARGREGERDTLRVIRGMALRIRQKLPIGHRLYVDEDKLVGDQPRVLIANHESMYDVMSILALPLPVQILVKRWVWKTPIMGAMTRRAGYILTQGTAAEDIIQGARESVGRGNSILIFPEGTRTHTGKMGRFHNGAFAIARELGVKVQPLCLVNSREVVPRNSWWIGDHEFRLAILDPMDPNAFTGEAADRKMAREARARIQARRDELWLETQQGKESQRVLAGMYRCLGPVISHYAAYKARLDPLVRALPSLCPGSGPLVVAGCGFGLMTARLALAWPERAITAIDVDPNKIQIAKAALGDRFKVEFRIADLRQMDLRQLGQGQDTHAFRPDYVLLVDLLHYFDEAGQRQVLERLADALPPGTNLIFREGCREAGKGHGMVHGTEQFARWLRFTRSRGKFCFRTQAGWHELLESCGFEVESSHPELGLFSNVVFLCRRVSNRIRPAMPHILRTSEEHP